MGRKEDPYRVVLGENEIPDAWYNIMPDLPVPPPPPIHPATREPCTADDLLPLFAEELVKQEVSQERYIEIPEPVMDVYKLYRPSPLHRAYRLEKELDTPAKIFYKNESLSPAGSHKPNTAIPQAYYNKAQGIEHLTTETGAGQWGSALALGCKLFGIDLEVYMVKISYQQKPYRRTMMEVWGERVRQPHRQDRGRQGDAGGGPGLPGKPGACHQRGGGGMHDQRKHQVCAGERSQLRMHAPDHSGPGGEGADGED